MGNELKGSEFIEKGYLDNAIKETKEYVELLKKADEELKSIAKTTRLGKGGLSAKGISQATTAYNTLNETRKKSILVDKEKAKAIKQLTDLQDEQVKGKLRFQRANKEQRDALKAEIVLNDQLAGTEEKLLAQNRLLRLERKKLIKGTKDYDRELKRINSTLDVNNQKMREASDLDKKRLLNIGNYKSAFKGLGKVFSALGITFALSAVGGFIKDLNLLANEAKGVEFAFNRLGDAGANAFDRVKRSTRGLLSDLNIKRALVEFDNFNISLEQADTLFEFLAVRATQTGVSIDKLKQSLVEGLSKESKLRIDNLGISAKQLNDQLEKTPDFVEAVATIAKREIGEAGDVLDDASNSQERFNAQWENFKLLFARFIQPALSSILNFATKFIDFVAEASNTIGNLFAETRKEVKALTAEQDILNQVTDDSVKSITEESASLRILINDLKGTTAGTKERQDALDEMNSKYGTTLENLEDETDFVNQLEVAYSNLVMQLSRKIKFDIARSKLTELVTKQITAEKELVSAQLEVANSKPIQDFNNPDFFDPAEARLKRAKNNIEDISKQIKALENTFKGVTPLENIIEPKKPTGGKPNAIKKAEEIIEDIEITAINSTKRIADARVGIEIEAIDVVAQKREEEAEKEKKQQINNAREITNFIAQETDRRIQLRQDEIRRGNDRINELTSIQTANSAQSIVALEKANANKEKEIEKLERRKRNLLISVVALERAGQLIGQGDTAPLANAGKGIADLLSNLPKFFKGTDKRVGDEMTKVRNTGRDDYLALVDKDEMIFTGNKVDSMAKVGLNTTDKITASAIAYQTQIANGRAMRTSSSKTMSDARIVNKLDAVEKAIDNIKIETTLLDPAFKRALVTGKGFTKIENYDNSEEI